MAYNMTPFESSHNLVDSFAAINTISGNLLINLGLIVFFVVVLVALLRRNPPPESFTAASGTTTVIAIMCLAAQLASTKLVVGFTLLFALSAIGLYLRNKTS